MQRAPNPKELRKGEGGSFRFRPFERWSSAVGLVKDRRGETIQSGAATVDHLDTTVAAYPDATRDRFQLTSVAGVSRGVAYLVTDPQFGAAVVEVATLDPATDLVALVAPLPSVPGVGALFQGIEVTFAVTAIDDIDLSFRAVVRGPASGQEQVVTFDVVYQPWQDPVTAADVSEFIARVYPGELPSWPDERSANLAQESCDHVRRQLRNAHRYEHRFWDTDALRECCTTAMRRQLAIEGLYPGAVDPGQYQSDLKWELKDRIGDVIQSTIPYDVDGNDRIDPSEFSITSGRLVR